MPADVTLTPNAELVESELANVTPAPTSSAERVRRHRARKKAAATATPLLYERADWQLFVQQELLPQKVGCRRDQLGGVVLKEAVDNALDTGTEVELTQTSDGYRIPDRGQGIDTADVPRLFAVNRPLLSSKLKRLPLRGMLGNGLRVVMGAVAAFGGKISVTTRGHRLSLAVDSVTGATKVLADDPVTFQAGTIVEISLGLFDGADRRAADLSLVVAQKGQQYGGPSHPAWNGVDDIRALV